jgi:predicted RNA-binding Zn ribbon-like protein
MVIMNNSILKERFEKFSKLDLDGKHLVFDFINTIDWRHTEREHEWVLDYFDILAWCNRKELLPENDISKLFDLALKDPQAASAAYDDALHLRETLFEIFIAVIEGLPIDKKIWNFFNNKLSNTMNNAFIDKSGSCFEWAFNYGKNPLEFFQYPILKAAADLLIDFDHTRLKKCATPDCGWLFVDNSKNKSKRWCDMESCGNRAKARRHYAKTRNKKTV